MVDYSYPLHLPEDGVLLRGEDALERIALHQLRFDPGFALIQHRVHVIHLSTGESDIAYTSTHSTMHDRYLPT